MIERGTDVYEACADAAHEAWSHWMRYLLDVKGVTGPTGAVVLSASDVAHWRRQIDTPYAELSERERDSDREQVDRYAHLVDPAPPPVVEPCDTCGHGRANHHKLRCEHPDCHWCNGWRAVTS